MRSSSNFSFYRLFNSFGYAFKGLATAFASQQNLWIHSFAVIVVCSLGFYYTIRYMEWIVLIICMGMVIAAELFNTALEYLCDKVEPQKNETIKKVKDISAGAVLILAITSLVIGLIIFLPYILRVCGKPV